MGATNEEDREERALDALIVAALRHDLCENGRLPDPTTPEPHLSEEDEKALAALGPDLVAKIVAGTWKSRPSQSTRVPPGSPRVEPELAGAMHRAGEEGEITEKAQEEIERKVRELDAEDEEARPGG